VKALRQLGVRDPVVLGHSWGVLVAVAIGLRANYPARSRVRASGYYFPTWVGFLDDVRSSNTGVG